MMQKYWMVSDVKLLMKEKMKFVDIYRYSHHSLAFKNDVFSCDHYHCLSCILAFDLAEDITRCSESLGKASVQC